MAPEARRDLILDAAQSLFMEQGWDSVTVADVQDTAGISRGGFYHHFAAKEDLLTGLIARMTEQAIQTTEAAVNHTVGDALIKLNGLLDGAAQWTADNVNELRGLVQIFSRPGNEIPYRRICDAEAAVVMPVLKAIIESGIAEGTFNPVDAGLTAELMLSLSQGRREVLIEVFDLASANDLDAAVDALDRRLRSEGEICDRLLGLPVGSVALSNRTEYRRMLAGLVQ
jgi:AcrR family transcriptional regulator